MCLVSTLPPTGSTYSIIFIVTNISSDNLTTFAHRFDQIDCGCMISFVKRLRPVHIRIMSAARFHHKCFLCALAKYAPAFIFNDCDLIFKFLQILSLCQLQFQKLRCHFRKCRGIIRPVLLH